MSCLLEEEWLRSCCIPELTLMDDNPGELHPWNSTQLAGVRDLFSAALLVRLLLRAVFSASISWRVVLLNLASLSFPRRDCVYLLSLMTPPPPSAPPLFEEMFQFGENCCTRPHLFWLLHSFQPPLSQHSLQRGWHRCWNIAWKGWYWWWNMATHWATVPQQSLVLGNFNSGCESVWSIYCKGKLPAMTDCSWRQQRSMGVSINVWKAVW